MAVSAPRATRRCSARNLKFLCLSFCTVTALAWYWLYIRWHIKKYYRLLFLLGFENLPLTVNFIAMFLLRNICPERIHFKNNHSVCVCVYIIYTHNMSVYISIYISLETALYKSLFTGAWDHVVRAESIPKYRDSWKLSVRK